MKKHIVVLAETASDIERGIDFYNSIEDGVGRYFRDSINVEPCFQPAAVPVGSRPKARLSIKHKRPAI